MKQLARTPTTDMPLVIGNAAGSTTKLPIPS